MSRVYTIVKGHVKTWFRSKSTIFWTLACPILLIVLFGAIFGTRNTRFDLYAQNQDLTANAPTPSSQGYVAVLNHTGAFNIQTVPAEMRTTSSYICADAHFY